MGAFLVCFILIHMINLAPDVDTKLMRHSRRFDDCAARIRHRQQNCDVEFVFDGAYLRLAPRHRGTQQVSHMAAHWLSGGLTAYNQGSATPSDVWGNRCIIISAICGNALRNGRVVAVSHNGKVPAVLIFDFQGTLWCLLETARQGKVTENTPDHRSGFFAHKRKKSFQFCVLDIGKILSAEVETIH